MYYSNPQRYKNGDFQKTRRKIWSGLFGNYLV